MESNIVFGGEEGVGGQTLTDGVQKWAQPLFNPLPLVTSFRGCLGFWARAAEGNKQTL